MTITGDTLCLPLIGHPVGQVRSPAIFNAYFAERGMDVTMFAVDIEPAATDAFFAALRSWRNAVGCSVTVPHKQAAFRVVNRVTDRARRVHAVNLIVREPDGTLAGDMTDGLAFMQALAARGIESNGKTVLVVGAAGGAGSAIADAFHDAHPACLLLVDPQRDKVERLAAMLRDKGGDTRVVVGWPGGLRPDVAVNASPVGMAPDASIPIDLARLASQAAVADIVTRPVMTPLLRQAERLGHSICTGGDMAAQQLEIQMKCWGLWRPDRQPVAIATVSAFPSVAGTAAGPRS